MVIVSHRDERWLKPCLDSLDAAAGRCAYRVTIVENGGSPIRAVRGRGSARALHGEPGFRRGEQRGRARFPAELLLFLNPDTELVERDAGALGTRRMRDRPEVGSARRAPDDGDGRLWPSLHRFPSVRRALAAALASEKWPASASDWASACWTPAPTRARTLRLDDRSGAGRSPGGIRGGRRFRRAVLPLLRGNRPMQAHPGRGWEATSSRGSRSFTMPARRECIRRARRRWPTPACSTPASTSAESVRVRIPRDPADAPRCCGSRSCASAGRHRTSSAGVGAGAPGPARQDQPPYRSHERPAARDGEP